MTDKPTEKAESKPPVRWPPPINLARGICAALLAAVLAYFAVYFLFKNGFYAMMLPGLAIGMACGYSSGYKSPVLGFIALAIVIVANALIEWHVFWNVTLGEFLMKYHTIGTMRLAMHLLGMVVAYWFGTGR